MKVKPLILIAAMLGVAATRSVLASRADTANSIVTGVQLISAALANSADSAGTRQPRSSRPQGGTTRLPEVSDETKQAITTMIQSLLAAVATQDTNQLLEIYAPTVDYMDHGIVNRDGLTADFKEYFSRWPTTRWAMGSSIVFKPATANRVQASFKINFDAANDAENRRSTGQAAETLLLGFDPSTHRFRIVAHHEKILGRYLSSSGSATNRTYSRTTAIGTQSTASSPPVALRTTAASPEDFANRLREIAPRDLMVLAAFARGAPTGTSPGAQLFRVEGEQNAFDDRLQEFDTELRTEFLKNVVHRSKYFVQIFHPLTENEVQLVQRFWENQSGPEVGPGIPKQEALLFGSISESPDRLAGEKAIIAFSGRRLYIVWTWFGSLDSFHWEYGELAKLHNEGNPPTFSSRVGLGGYRSKFVAQLNAAVTEATEIAEAYADTIEGAAKIRSDQIARRVAERDKGRGDLPEVEALRGYGKCLWGSSVQSVIQSRAVNPLSTPRPLTQEERQSIEAESGLKVDPSASKLEHNESDKRWLYIFFDNELAMVIYVPPEAVQSDGEGLLASLEQKYGKLKRAKIQSSLEQKYATAGANIAGSQLGVSINLQNLLFSTENDVGGLKAFGVETKYSKYAGFDLGKAIENKIEEAVEGAKTQLRVNQIIYYSAEHQKRAGESKIQLEEQKKRAAEEEKKKRIETIKDDL